MAKQYWLQFASGDPRTYTGLAPTLLIFKSFSGVALTAPGITESIASSGLYKFEYTPSFSIAFLADGATTGLVTADRYIAGVLDPSDAIDETTLNLGSSLTALSSTQTAMGSTLVGIGNTTIAYGGSIFFLTTNIGTTLTATGSTIVGIGNTGNALGSTNFALGTLNLAQGSSILALDINIGSTLVGIGNTSIAYGGTIFAITTNTGSTLVGIGNTSIAYGGTILAVATNFGVTQIAEGVTIVAIGNSLSALSATFAAFGSSLGLLTTIDTKIGSTASSFGSTVTDPGTLFGHLKRNQEFNEGNAAFNKSTGVWDVYSRGSSTLLAEKTLTNTATTANKS